MNGSSKDSLQLKWLKHPKRDTHVHRIPRIGRMPLQATACTEEIKLKMVKAYKTLEIIAMEVRINSKDILLMGIYRPPKQSGNFVIFALFRASRGGSKPATSVCGCH